MSELNQPEVETPVTRIEVKLNGPLIVHGNLEVTLPDGSVVIKSPRAGFCRCGQSNKKPFCDGTHKTCGWEG